MLPLTVGRCDVSVAKIKKNRRPKEFRTLSSLRCVSADDLQSKLGDMNYVLNPGDCTHFLNPMGPIFYPNFNSGCLFCLSWYGNMSSFLAWEILRFDMREAGESCKG